MTETHYEVLGVASNATSAEIKSAYRNLAMVVHPDQGGPAALFQRVSVAYEVLTDPVRRDSYDQFLAAGGCDPDEFRRRERRWRERAEHRPDAGATTPRTQPAPKRPDTDTRVPPQPPEDSRRKPEHKPPDRATHADPQAQQASYARHILHGATLSTAGFWIVQILWLVIDDDLDDISDVIDLSRSTWWILALAVANLVMALRLRAQHRHRHTSPSLVVTTIASSALLLIIFLARGVDSDDLGVWPAAIGAAISAVNAWLLRRACSENWGSRAHTR